VGEKYQWDSIVSQYEQVYAQHLERAGKRIMLRRIRRQNGFAGFFLLIGWARWRCCTARSMRNWLGRLPEAVACPWPCAAWAISKGGPAPPGGALPGSAPAAGARPYPGAASGRKKYLLFGAVGLRTGGTNATLGAELRPRPSRVCVATLGALAGALFLSYRETSRLTSCLFFFFRTGPGAAAGGTARACGPTGRATKRAAVRTGTGGC